MYCTHLTSQEIEQATAEYHVANDLEAMANRIDALLEENAKLNTLLDHHKDWLRIANDQWSKADELAQAITKLTNKFFP